MNPLEKLTKAQALLAKIGQHLLSTRVDALHAKEAAALIAEAQKEIEAELAKLPAPPATP